VKMRVITTDWPVSEGQSLIDLLPEGPLTFIRNGDGIVGWGEHTRLVARGAHRASQLADQWRALCATAEVENSVNLPGTGLVAFGAITFADNSAAESVLIVPKVLLGSRDGRFWITSIDGAQLPKTTHPDASGDTVTLGGGELSRSGFKAAVDSALDEIGSGRVEKVVLARDLVAEVGEEFDLRAPLRRFAHNYPTCWVYSVDGLFGASPELLVRVSHGQVSARVLAGTAGRGTDPGVDLAIGQALAESHKNVTEHAFAVDSMVRALAPFCSHVDADPKPFSLKLPNVWHLASDVHGVLGGEASVLDLAAAIHPTAAVAGTPRDKAVELIGELEPFDRGRYAGPVGWIGADGDGEWAIALRGAQLTGTTVRAFAGCGIVAESDADSEAAETDLKFQPIIQALTN
jgi:menaquinone-specific isochorismate synthase